MDYIMESVKNVLGESSIGWKKIKKNQYVLNELKDWLRQYGEYEIVLQKIKELEEKAVEAD